LLDFGRHLFKRLFVENRCKNSGVKEDAFLPRNHFSFHIRGFVLKPFLPCFNPLGNSISELAVNDQGKSQENKEAWLALHYFGIDQGSSHGNCGSLNGQCPTVRASRY
jgi:hypothetical protein